MASSTEDGSDEDDDTLTTVQDIFLYGQQCEAEDNADGAVEAYEEILGFLEGDGVPVFMHKPEKDGLVPDPPSTLIYSCTLNSYGGLCLDRGGEELGRARSFFQRAVRAWNKNLMALLNLANLEREYGDFHSALNLYRKIVRYAPATFDFDNVDGGGWEGTYIYEPMKTVREQAYYLCALCLHQVGKFDEALEYLRAFPVQYRVHPKVWTAAHCLHANPTTTTAALASPPTLYKHAIPPLLKHDLCTIFSKTAPFWAATDYHERGYYSFWYDLAKKPRNTVEDLVQHLLPLAEARAGELIVGAEWWVHSRPVGRNLGHQLHLDTEENTLEATQSVVHPRISSVCYLSDLSAGDGGGSTVVFDQALGQPAADRAYVVRPCESGFMMFDGDKIHGVLPSAPLLPASEDSSLARNSKRRKTEEKPKLAKKDELPHRLTLMIGFWTTNVEQVGTRTLLGPCGPTPLEATADCPWPKYLQSPYFFLSKDAKQADAIEGEKKRELVPIDVISPAWERIEANDNSTLLDIPESIDQHFFVKDMKDFRSHLNMRTA